MSGTAVGRVESALPVGSTALDDATVPVDGRSWYRAPPMLRLFDTAAGTVVPLELREPGKVSMYVCGPTVYGPPHLGHGRFSLVFDVLRRYLEWTGLDVTYVSNITDIDDKIIDSGPAEEGRDPARGRRRVRGASGRRHGRHRRQAPDHDPHATAYVDADGRSSSASWSTAATPTRPSDGVYFGPSGVDGYGLLARQPLETLRGRGPASRSTTRSARPSTSRSGRRPSRASRRGPRRGARAGRAGTPSAW